jgi:hypothetical protein
MAPMTNTTRKLGKRLGVVNDPRTIQAVQILDVPAVKTPADHRIAHTLSTVPVFGNDRIGDCTCASQGHRIVSQETSSGQHDHATLSDDDVIAVYSAVAGYDPATGANDNGAYELDVLNYMRKTGMGHQKDGTPHTIGAFAKVDLTDRETIAASHYVFGGIKLCAALPITAEQQLDAGEDWTVVAGGGSDSEPGSWGGHSMYSVGYDHKRGILVWTWGREQWMSWEWAAQYGDEAYALISNDYLRGSGKTPQGFDQTALNALLKRIDG